jgi:hypothetical protein
LGFFGKEELVILSPKKEVNAYKNVPGGYQEISKEESITLKDAIGLYQSAFNRYKSGQMDANPPS